MRVWIPSEKRHREHTATRWSVEWWTIDPQVRARVEAAEPGSIEAEIDPVDDLVANVIYFPTRETALAAAPEFAALGYIQAAHVRRQDLDALAGDVWEWTDDQTHELEEVTP